MGMKSPNRNFSIDKLNYIRSNNYYDEFTGKDYAPDEVDNLLWEKQRDKEEKEHREYLRNLVNQEIENDYAAGLKRCSKCNWKLPLSYFSPDKSKKLKLRSHCKDCRNVHLKHNLTVVQCYDILVA